MSSNRPRGITAIVVEIRERQLEVTPALRNHVERRAGFALGRLGWQVAGIVVRFLGAGGAGGSRDVRAQVDVRLETLGNVRAEDTASDAFLAVGRALLRASRAAARAIARQRSWDLGLIRGAST